MKVKFYGFEWHTDAPFQISEFCQFLEANSGVKIKDEIFVMTAGGEWFTGLLLSIRDAKSFCKMVGDEESFLVSAQQLEARTNMVDFNFFIVHSQTGRGLYQHYYGATSLRLFASLAAKRCHTFKKQKMDAHFQLHPELRGPEKASLRQSFKDFLHTTFLVKPKKFAEYVRELKKVDRFSCEVSTYTPTKRLFQPLAEKATRQRVSFKFDPAANMVDLAEEIAKLAEADELENASVEGYDSRNQKQEYKLFKDTQVFAEHDYDNVLNSVSIDSADLKRSVKDSVIIARLIEVANSTSVRPLLTMPR